ncbi:limonene-1,2-epoxide hydrolase [Pyruvatibacter mobilis]|uniref:Limonene-1,2-epoxide hydrolase n=1 Tax=Pyruvatibacter mobilis TaxID=1712261 RepID=A0A845Q7I3_9HYPH|nr:limonene-1,2-epoxide hydrolase family protein [Pyruvatibacter mobilis]NBG94130.1 limonene-1,2-epoxide hydrolase [Pyruvatibacter mobilis]QJD76441.1 SnoaL-like domain-containing protein [Pyruvatibacter mobilis]GGD00600.1 limonene-1,2-epoxide hydrolase [Pyruvatibacter mobilis]
MSANTDVVDAFVAAWNARDFDRLMSFFDAESFYHNLPLDPVTGTEAIRGVLEMFFNSASEIDWVMHGIAETPSGTVLTERTDRFLINGQWLELPVMGAFEIDGSIIRAWRDYFDLKKFEADMARVSG